MRHILGMVTAAVVAVSGMAYPEKGHAQDPEQFKIGSLLAMTGAAPQYGKVMSQGILLAVENINAAGGIDGIKMEAVIGDHQSGSAKEAVATMNRMISVDGVQAVLSSFSGPTMAIAPIADREKVFVINGGGVSVDLINASKYMVHNRVLATELAKSIIKIADERGYKRAAIIHRKNESGDSVRDLYLELWTGDGREIVATEAIVQGSANIDTQIAKVKVARPDVIFLGLWQPDVGLAVKRIRELQIDVDIIGVDWTPTDANIAGKYGEGHEFVLESFALSDTNPWSGEFYDSYMAKYGEAPDIYAANYYEGTYVIAELIRRAKAKGGDYWSGDKLYEAMWDNPEFKSLFGPTMTFDPETGLAAKPLNFFRVDAEGHGAFVGFVGGN